MAYLVFEQWQERLEHHPELYGMRFFAPEGGKIWRNAAARKYYEARGFFGAATMAWDTIKVYLSPEEIGRLEDIWLRAFETGEPIDYLQTSQAPGHPPTYTVTRFLAVYGNTERGVLITHLKPLPLVTSYPVSICPSLQRPGVRP